MAYVEWRGGRWKVQVRSGGQNAWHDLPAEIRRDQRDLAKAVGSGMAERIRTGRDAPAERGETVREWYGRWLSWRENRGDGDIGKLRQRFERYLAEQIGALPMHSVRREHLKAVVADLDRRVTAGEIAWKTAANVWSQCVSRAFKDAADGKEPTLCVLTENPAVGVRAPDRGARVRKQYLYPEEALQLVACEDVPLVRRRLYAFAIYTYLRAGEIAALRWEDVDLVRGIIHVHQSMDRVVHKGLVTSTKTDEARRVTIEPALRPLVEAMHKEKASPLVFPTLPPAGGPDGQAPTLRADLERAKVARASLLQRPETRTRKWMTFHDLRATGITWAAIRGDDAMKIMSRSGHSEYQTMLGYVREAEVVREGFGEVFPELPATLLGRPRTAPLPQENGGKPRESSVPKGIRIPVAMAANGPRLSAFGREDDVASAPNTTDSLGALAEAFLEAVASGDALGADALQFRLAAVWFESRTRAIEVAERLLGARIPIGGASREEALQ